MVRDLAARANMPMPRVYLIDEDQPNAFATGRNPQNAAVAATTGILRTLSYEELAGVMAHELAHIKNHDTLTMTITATMAGAISSLVTFGMMFGSRENRPNLVVQILLSILAPMAAMVIQMAISRSREYEADKLGGEICRQSGLARRCARQDRRRRRAYSQRDGGGEACYGAHVHHQSPDWTAAWIPCSRLTRTPAIASPR